jgi:septal ring factor EnvC (AmiA/AmiB activator)
MKKLIEFVKDVTRIEWVILLCCLIAIALSIYLVTGKISDFRNEGRINKLETEKQQILKERDEARQRDLILQGQIQAKDEQIQDLTSRIADSNQRVTNAHNETQTARANVNKVRNDAPKFNAPDDAGRISEFSSAVRDLYSDPPR